MNRKYSGALVGTLLAAFVGFPSAKGSALGLDSEAPKTGYAEMIYSDFEKFSQNKIDIDVNIAATYPLSNVKSLTFATLLGTPTHALTYNESAIAIEDLWFSSVDIELLKEVGRDEMLGMFETLGYSTNSAVVRELVIQVSLSGSRKIHKALEICWTDLGKCVLADIAIPNLESTVLGIRSSIADGWSASTDLGGVEKQAGACRVSSNLSSSYARDVKESFSRTSKDWLNRTKYSITVPSAEARIDCVYSSGNCNAISTFPQGQPLSTSAGGNSRAGYSWSTDKASLRFNGANSGPAAAMQVTGGGYRYGGGSYLNYELNRAGSDIVLSRSTNSTVFQNAPKVRASCILVQ